MRLLLAALFLVLVPSLVPALVMPAAAATVAEVNSRIDAVLDDHRPYETAVHAFQKAVTQDDRKTVAGFFSFPARLNVNGKKTRIASRARFLRRYDGIITPAVASAVKNQKYEDLFVNAQGVMFGNGQAWLVGICRDTACKSVRIQAVINN